MKMLTHIDLAERLRAAYGGVMIEPLRDGLAPNDIDGAYKVQQINTDYWRNLGRKIVGHKIGLTSIAVQQQLGVDQPDFGVLFDDMHIEDGGQVPLKALIQPKAEVEIALVLGNDVPDDDCTIEGIFKAADYAVCAIEIVDSRIRDWHITFADTVADNGSSGLFVLGQERKKLEGLDLYSCGMVLECNDNIASLGTGAACLGHPLKAAAWLAQTLVGRHQGLRAGDIIMTGALGPMIALTPGDRITAKIGGLGQCNFSYEGFK